MARMLANMLTFSKQSIVRVLLSSMYVRSHRRRSCVNVVGVGVNIPIEQRYIGLGWFALIGIGGLVLTHRDELSWTQAQIRQNDALKKGPTLTKSEAFLLFQICSTL